MNSPYGQSMQVSSIGQQPQRGPTSRGGRIGLRKAAGADKALRQRTEAKGGESARGLTYVILGLGLLGYIIWRS